jgi:hypothetical protein
LLYSHRFIGAATIEDIEVSLSDTTINVKPTMTVTGTAKDFSMSAGSCFKISYAQPYVKS